MTAYEGGECPVPAAHRRLVDVHELWHQLGAAYMDPTAFRRLLNIVIPELRNVSFLIQKQKAVLDGYAEWYPRWQAAAGNDPVMRWVVKSRNRVVKEGDLELLSTLKLRYQSIRHQNLGQEWPDAPAKLSVDELLSWLLQRGRLPQQGLLTVSRRWLDSALPRFELLGATAHAWRTCARLVSVAHAPVSTDNCFDSSDWTRECVVSSLALEDFVCLLHPQENFERAIDLSDWTIQRTRMQVIGADEAGPAEARERYGELPAPASGDAIDRVPILLRMGRQILEVDDDLLTTVHYFRGDQTVDVSAVTFANNMSVVRHMQQVADRIGELGADSVAISSEVWIAVYDEAQKDVRAGDRSDRTEALLIQAVGSDGTARLVILPFSRDDSGRRRFGTPSSASYVAALEPLRQAWGLKRWWILAEDAALEGCRERPTA